VNKTRQNIGGSVMRIPAIFCIAAPNTFNYQKQQNNPLGSG